MHRSFSSSPFTGRRRQSAADVMRLTSVLILPLLAACCAQQAEYTPRMKRAEEDFWNAQPVNYNSGSIKPGEILMEIPVNDVPAGSDKAMDKIQVSSAALFIRPKTRGKHDALRNLMRRKRELVQSWRKPRHHQFVTNKSDRLPPPPIVRVYPPMDRNERFYDRDYRKAQRRIIYYANLPEIVRPPVQWYNRGDYYESNRQSYPSASPSSTVYTSSIPASSAYPSTQYPSPSENEITRVQSNIIDVVNTRYSGYPQSQSSTPKFTIIDVEPPYNYPSYDRRPPVRYELYPLVQPQYTPNRFYNDIRTPPYRDHSHYSGQNFRPDSSLEPVKLQIPTTDFPSTINSTDSPVNTTRYLPDNIPVSLSSLSKFVT